MPEPVLAPPAPLPTGTRVRVRPRDAATHTRAPRYVRGHTGVVVAAHGEHPLPDAVVTGASPPDRGWVYAVRFDAAALFGEGRHGVTVNLWEQYLEVVDP